MKSRQLFKGGSMRRILIAIMALTLLVSCSTKTEEGTETTAKPPQGEQARTEPVSAIYADEEFGEIDRLADAHIRPYFDAEATQTEKAVSAGEYFDLYVIAEYNELYPMSAAEYKLVLPEGVVVMGMVQTDSTILTLGKWDNDFMIAFRCTSGPKAMLVKYQCKAEDDFTGGTIETVKGMDLNFLGFTLCDEIKTMVKGKGGTAEISKK
jgi:hypothetical protein